MRRLTVITVNASLAVVSGYGARDLITELRHRPPMWSSRPRGWCVQPAFLADLEVLGERRGYLVVLEDGSDAA